MKYISTNYKNINIETFDKFDNLKVVVFDFDFTLYRGLDWEGYNDFFIKSIRKFFPNLSYEEFETNLKKYHIKNSDRVSENTAKMMIDFFGSASVLVDFLKTVKYPTNWNKATVFPSEILKGLKNKYTLYIVSNSSKENIEFVSKNIGLNLIYFKDILPNNFVASDLSKMHRLQEIIHNECVSPSEILMVGDSIKYDLLPAKKIGAKTLLIND